MSLLIRNVRAIDPASGLDGLRNILLDDGRITAIAEASAGFTANQEIDASGLWAFPGGVDLAAWLREPGLDHKATLKSETYAAAASGITTLCYQPEPGVNFDSAAQVKLIDDLNRQAGFARVAVLGNLTQGLKGEQLSNMGSLKKAGCVAVTNGWQPFKSLQTLRRAMEYAATHELTVFVYPLEHALAAGGYMHEGEVSARLGFPAIPSAAETVAVAQTLALASHTGARVHFCRLSARLSVKLIRQGKDSGLDITADVAAHQLFLTEVDVSDFNPLCHVMPPLRSSRDRDALREGLADGTIDAICSDHQPHEIDAKLAPFQQTEPGIAGLETLLPLTLRLVEEKVLTLPEALRKLTSNPARIIGSEAGRVRVGAPADLVLFNPDSLWELDLNHSHSAGKNTPFAGWNFSGAVQQTFVAGKRVFHV
ncbi:MULTISPECIES: dihydroorotase [Thiothrix]|jgi:dihydroorotase|uniref:Dihydroorotase n=2 Tax=Thiothrix TaxID=1030 RepID=A0A1Y1QP84_9GAMM|nr:MULTISPECIES: dihydroorotase [Thiothrix]MDX9987260.1 dihydroorotase [Thiothrix unzii]OQX10302.1 MAG: dihydroorotase [Thiothrix lacustris]QTR50629.1 dihydroorotase [Candidatus Thiothrix anitrata]